MILSFLLVDPLVLSDDNAGFLYQGHALSKTGLSLFTSQMPDCYGEGAATKCLATGK